MIMLLFKNKYIFAIRRNLPYSERPSVREFSVKLIAAHSSQNFTDHWLLITDYWSLILLPYFGKINYNGEKLIFAKLEQT